MTDFLKTCWQSETGADRPEAPLSKQGVLNMLRDRSATARAAMRRRYANTAASYVFILVLMLANLFDPVKPVKLAYFAWALLILGTTAVVLHIRARDLRDVALDASLAASLERLIARATSIRGAMRVAVLAFLIPSLGLLGYLVATSTWIPRSWFIPWLVAWGALACLVSAWGSGRYVARAYDRDIAELRSLLDELQQ
jgi:hypothetical protein